MGLKAGCLWRKQHQKIYQRLVDQSHGHLPCWGGASLRCSGLHLVSLALTWWSIVNIGGSCSSPSSQIYVPRITHRAALPAPWVITNMVYKTLWNSSEAYFQVIKITALSSCFPTPPQICLTGMGFDLRTDDRITDGLWLVRKFYSWFS